MGKTPPDSLLCLGAQTERVLKLAPWLRETGEGRATSKPLASRNMDGSAGAPLGGGSLGASALSPRVLCVTVTLKVAGSPGLWDF